MIPARLMFFWVGFERRVDALPIAWGPTSGVCGTPANDESWAD